MGISKQHLPPQDSFHIANCMSFCNEVETLIAASNKKADEREENTNRKTLRLGYVEAVLVVAEKRRIEPDLAAAYLNPEIKSKLRKEWEQKNMIHQKAKLPF